MKKVSYTVKETLTDIEIETYDSEKEAFNALLEMRTEDIENEIDPIEMYIETQVKHECDFCGEEIDSGRFCSKDCAIGYQSDN